MALDDYRVIDYPEKTSVDNTDFVMTDSESNGTNKYQVSRIITEAEAKVAAAVAAEAEAREAADEALQTDIDTRATSAELAAEATAREQDVDDLKADLSNRNDSLMSVLQSVAWEDAGGLRRVDMLRRIFDDVIPENYMLLDYIESDTNKFVNTKVLSQNPLEIEAVLSVDLKPFEWRGGSGIVYTIREFGPIVAGAISGNGRGRFYALGLTRKIASSYDTNVIPCMHDYRIGDNDWTQVGEYTGTDDVLRIKNVITSTNIKYIVNNQLIATNPSPTNVDYGAELYLFRNPIAFPSADSPELKKCRVYSLIMSVNDITVFEGIPVYDKSSGISGLYDIINQVFHPLVDSE